VGRYSLRRTPVKLWGSVRTDYGYRRTYAWRNVEGESLL
jgi:hypothetical protein